MSAVGERLVLYAQVGGKEAKLNRATLCLGDLEAKDEIVTADPQDGCASRETLCWLLKGREPLLLVPSQLPWLGLLRCGIQWRWSGALHVCFVLVGYDDGEV
jgi:hypothetical protein